jgi:signal transduction histidine kinase
MILQWWKNLSVSRKLYSVVGLMGLLICTELFTLIFAMNTLSAVRALVNGEGDWSKGQKDAIQDLQEYVVTGDEAFLKKFSDHIKVPLGDHEALVQLEKPDMNYDLVFQGFVQGKVHPDDIKQIIKLLRRFSEVPYLQQAIGHWQKGNELMSELLQLRDQVEEQMKSGKNVNQMELLHTISDLNDRFSNAEGAFSATLGEASRWLEHILMMGLVLAVLTIEGVGLFLTFSFTSSLSRTLKALTEASHKIGQGDFSKLVPVHSTDELGQLAQSINQMTLNLQYEESQRQQAEHASHAKNLFLANMSHEIRTPLNAILGFTDLLKDPNLGEAERSRYVDIIRRTGLNLSTIINDILDVTKIEADQMKVEMVTFSLPQFLKDLEVLMRLRCDEKGLTLKIQSDGPVAEFIFSDPLRLRQILINIIGNAIKYTDRGSIVVSYFVKNKSLIFKVADTGNGISNDVKPLLFRPFSQGDISSQKKYGGTGLGLTLSRKLSQLLGGDVILEESEPGVGSVFSIRVAYTPSNEKNEIRPQVTVQVGLDNTSRGKKVLVVEDTVDNQLLLKVYLSRLGFLVDVADNGLEGVEKASQDAYDMILMDMQMPIMDGYTATKALRQNGYRKPVIALTAYAMQGDREKTLQAGCTDYLAKPLDKEKLFEVINRYLG